MSFLIALLTAFTVFIVKNKNMSDEKKIGFYIIVGAIVILYILFNIIF